MTKQNGGQAQSNQAFVVCKRGVKGGVRDPSGL
jgi:hypothetical protein